MKVICIVCFCWSCQDLFTLPAGAIWLQLFSHFGLKLYQKTKAQMCLLQLAPQILLEVQQSTVWMCLAFRKQIFISLRTNVSNIKKNIITKYLMKTKHTHKLPLKDDDWVLLLWKIVKMWYNFLVLTPKIIFFFCLQWKNSPLM